MKVGSSSGAPQKWPRHLLTVLSVLKVLTVMCFLALASSCMVTTVEVARVTSPDGKFDAVVVEGDGGATTSYWYDLRVVERGKKFSAGPNVASLYGASRNEDAYGVNVKWSDPRVVTFEYWKSRNTISRLSRVNLADQEVTINLRSGVLDSSAAPGGMAYNLTKR